MERSAAARGQIAQRRMSKAETSDDSLVMFNLPPRNSVSALEDAPRLSYYNNQLFVPFKWEAAPGTPMQDSSSGEGSPECAQLRPPPAAGTAKVHCRSDSDEFFDVDNNLSTPPAYGRHQRSRLPPKHRSFGRSVNFFRNHNNKNSAGNESKRSEFDWPEVSDSEFAEEDVAAEFRKDEHYTGSFSSSSYTSSSSSTAVSGGGSDRQNAMLRNMMLTTSSKPFDDNDDEVQQTKGFLSCMPVIFPRVRMIQSQLRKSGKRVPAIDFNSRLAPGLKNGRH